MRARGHTAIELMAFSVIMGAIHKDVVNGGGVRSRQASYDWRQNASSMGSRLEPNNRKNRVDE